jgi:hypothetical protein
MPRPPKPVRRCLVLLLFATAARVGLLNGAEDISLGPLAEHFRLTLDLGERTEIFGPLFYHQTSGEPGNVTDVWALPPLFSHGFNDDLDSEFYDFLWKGATYTRYGKESRFQLLQWFSFSGGQTQADADVRRFTLFPFYFQQRSPIPEKNYTALFPFYGTIKNRLFRDEIRVVLFPVYGQSRRRGVVTDNWLYPFFHWRRGDQLSGWQVWPIAGHEHKQLTLRTNRWGDVEPIGGHDQFFALWPFFSNQRAGLGTSNQLHQQAFIPFYSYVRSPARDSTSYGWPFGLTHTIERERKYAEWGAPWPLNVFAHGEGKTTRRIWPLFSHASNASQASDWYLWPVYKHNRLHSDPLDRERTRVMLFLYSDLSVKNTQSGTRQRRIDLWPLFTANRDFDGRSRLQVLALLEPFLPGNPSVERDLAPLWSIWRSERHATRGMASQSFLWNLYRRETTPTSRKCSLLFGLFQYQSDPDRQRWRLFYVPVGKKKPPARQGSESR